MPFQLTSRRARHAFHGRLGFRGRDITPDKAGYDRTCQKPIECLGHHDLVGAAQV